MSKRENIERLLNPRSIVFVGGRDIAIAIESAKSIGYPGEIWAVSASRSEIAGIKTHASLSELPGTPEAAFLAVRAETSIEIVKELNGLGCAGAVCYAAGFSESGRSDLQDDLRNAAGDMAIVGPNCYGVLNYLDGVAMWPDNHGGKRTPRGVAIVSQSGNVNLTLSMSGRGLQFSYLISNGNQAVLDASDFIDVLVDDPRVPAIGLYIEGVRDLQKFRRAGARALDRGIPIVALKVGASDVGRQMTRNHTGSDPGTDSEFQTLFDELGIIRVESMREFAETLKMLSITGPLAGPNVGVLTCSGADSVLFADLADAQGGIALPPLTSDQAAELRSYMANFVTLSNPLDFNTQVWGNLELETRCFEGALRGEQFDAVALIHDFPRADCSDLADWVEVCDAFIAARNHVDKPAVMISNFGGGVPDDTHARLCARGITPLDGMQEGVAALRHAAWYGKQRARLVASESAA